MQAILNIAIEAAREAGKIISRNMSHIHSLPVQAKEKNNFVSEVDLKAEQKIIDVIHRVYPRHRILAEESGDHFSVDSGGYQWIVDPLDGTINFLRGFPHYSVSIALKYRDRLEVAVIYDPFKNELFCASRGNGASLNDRKIRVSDLSRFNGALLSTDCSSRENWDTDAYLQSLKKIARQHSNIRHAGSTALDLAYVAAGRADGFWGYGVKPWNIAAGCLIVQEAGGLVGDPQGGHTHLETGNIVAANVKVFRLLLQALNQ